MNKFRSGFILGVLLAVMTVYGVVVAQESGEITVNYMESGTYNVAAEELAEAFAAETGVSVDVVAFPWAVLRQNNTTDLLTSAGQYDVMSGGYYLADVYTNFLPLTDYITADNYGEGMIPGVMAPGSSEWFNGEQIGIPYGIDAYGLLVNNEMLATAGVEPNFATWQDFIAACEQIEAALPDVACFSHSTGNPEQIGAFFFSAYDGYYVDAEGNYELDTEKATAAMELLPTLWSYLPEGGAALSFDEAHQVFMDGRAAMVVTWPSFVANTLDAPESGVSGNWSQVSFPGTGFPWLSLWQQFIPASTDNPEAAWEWVKAFTGEANARAYYEEYSINSVWLSTYEEEELAAQHEHQWPAMLDGFSRAKNPPLSGESQDFLTNTAVEVATGQISAAEAVANINSTWASIPVPPALLEAATLAGLREE